MSKAAMAATSKKQALRDKIDKYWRDVADAKKLEIEECSKQGELEMQRRKIDENIDIAKTKAREHADAGVRATRVRIAALEELAVSPAILACSLMRDGEHS
jgi:uncharacterized protein (DUF2147 family)